ncbi:MAG: YdcF family protein [Clostridium sp.]|jgi:uncharacterized SAM-binding protein YcdF (DUF218 family)|nr:YdcF family protein [Clostridium sp.]
MIAKHRKIPNIIILILGIIGIFDFCFLALHGAAIGNFGVLFPLVTGILLTLFAVIRLSGKGHLLRIKNTVLRRGFILVCILFMLSFVLIEGFIIFSATADRDVEVDYVFILGTGLRGEQITPTFKNRIDKGLEYLRVNPDLMVVVTGGQGPGEAISEAEAMRRYLVNNGIDESRIIMEDKSTSTAENMEFSADVLEQLTGRRDYRIMIVTSEFHLFRSKILARHNGFTAYGIPSPTNPYELPNSFIREYFAVVKSLVFDIMLD